MTRLVNGSVLRHVELSEPNKCIAMLTVCCGTPALWLIVWAVRREIALVRQENVAVGRKWRMQSRRLLKLLFTVEMWFS